LEECAPAREDCALVEAGDPETIDVYLAEAMRSKPFRTVSVTNQAGTACRAPT
jgi:hypothetical protein